MPWNRRQFLHRATAFSGAVAIWPCETAWSQDKVKPGWKRVAVTTHVEVLKPAGVTRVWVPTPLAQPNPFQRVIRNNVVCDTGKARVVSADNRHPAMVVAEFATGAKPALTLSSEIETRDWAVDLSELGQHGPVNRAELNQYLRPTNMLPTDGIVRARALEITKSSKTELGKARAIYDWIVENTYRNPKTRGCGIGNIRFMLESGDLGGKCADLNALYVGLARAAGLPARDVYGLRIAPSAMGCKSLGVTSSNVTKAQHCRAEVFLAEHGWVPVDPADVRKVILEEPGEHHSLKDELVMQARDRLFGSWEMNWLAYNYAQDVVLPGAGGPPIHFLMYPQAETAGGRLDSLDPDTFRYEITAHEQSV